MIDTPEVLAALKAHAAKEAPREACGLVLPSGYLPCENIAPGLNHFCIAQEVYERHEHELLGIAHSHVGIPPRPSGADRASCRATGVPWLILSHPSELHQVVFPGDLDREPLMERVYVEGVQDCLVFVLDALDELYGVTFPPDAFPRSAHHDWKAMVGHAQAAGFQKLDADAPLQAGDVVLMYCRGEGHLGLITERSTLLHHNRGGLSCETPFDGYWRRHHVVTLRHAAI